jgi:hypothetical protein
MIGAIDEAKAKAKAGKPAAKAQPGSKTEAKGDPKSADSKSKIKAEPLPKVDPKSKPEVEHAAADAHKS